MNFLNYNAISNEVEAKERLNGFVVNVVAVQMMQKEYFEVRKYKFRGEVTCEVEPKLTIRN
jgi:hypothetical protein